MKFKDPVFEGLFLKRYKRFFADVEYKGQVVTAHVANTGSMRGLIEKEAPCLITFNDSPTRKLKYTLQAIQAPTSWVGINTSLPNGLVLEAFQNQKIKHWLDYTNAKPEHKISAETRLDLYLTGENQTPLYVEVKNVTLAENEVALFPDSVTSRGLKHLHELIELVEGGSMAEMVFVVQRTDCSVFRPAVAIDPKYAEGLKKAHNAGVKISAYTVAFESDGITLDCDREIRVEV